MGFVVTGTVGEPEDSGLVDWGRTELDMFDVPGEVAVVGPNEAGAPDGEVDLGDTSVGG